MARRRFTAAQRRLIRDRQSNTCACGCGEALGARVEFDHERALWAGGTDTIDNLRALRPGCHAKKTAAEAKQRAKEGRIRDQDGLRRKKRSRKEKWLAKFRDREAAAR